MSTIGLEQVTVYHTAFPGKGIGYANNQLVIVSSGWMSKSGITTNWSLFWTPDKVLERLNFAKLRDLLEFVQMAYECLLNLEVSTEKVNRPKDPSELPGWWTLTADWVDEALETCPETDLENEYVVAFLDYRKKNTASAKYARSEKGKLTQKKWRQSDSAQDQAEVRRKAKKAKVSYFKAVEAWLVANPGKTFYDLPPELAKQPEPEDEEEE